MIKVVSWNIAKKHQPWRELLRMDADVALLQEAGDPPWDLRDKVDTGPQEHWDSHFGIRTGIDTTVGVTSRNGGQRS